MTEVDAIAHAVECYPDHPWDDAHRLVGTGSYIVTTYRDTDVAVATDGHTANLLRVQLRCPNAG